MSEYPNISQVTHRLATDGTLQSTNTALGLLAKDATLESIVTAIGSAVQDATMEATNSALGDIKDAIEALPNATQDAADAANAAAAAANDAVATIGAGAYGIPYCEVEPGDESLFAKSLWSLNSIDNTTGADVDNGKWLRTNNYIPFDYQTDILWWHIKPNPYDFAVATYMYASDKSYLGYTYTTFHGGHLDPDDITENIIYPIDSRTKYVRFMVYTYAQQAFPSIRDILQYVDVVKVATESEFGSDGFFNQMKVQCGVKIWLPSETSTGEYCIAATKSRAVSMPIAVGKGTKLAYAAPNGLGSETYYSSTFWPCEFDKDFELLRAEADVGNYELQWTAQEDCYIRLQFQYLKDGTIAITDQHVQAILDAMNVYYIPPTSKDIVPFNYAQLPDLASSLEYRKWMTAHTTGANYDSGYKPRVLTEYLPIGRGTVIYSTNMSTDENTDSPNKMCAVYYDKNFIRLGGDGNWVSQTIAKQDGYVRVILRRNNAVDVSDSDFAVMQTYLHGCLVEPTDSELRNTLAVCEQDAIERGVENIYKERIQEVSQEYCALAETDQLGYAWMSDLHVRTEYNNDVYFNRFVIKRQVRAMCRAAEMAGLDFICIGGDVINAESSKANVYRLMADLRKEFEKCNVPVVWLFGNHDNNAYGNYNVEGERFSQEISQSKTAALFCGKSNVPGIVWGDKDVGYFYFDIPNKNKRIVCLNGNAPEGSAHTDSWWCINKAQVQWFCNMLLTNTYDIVILTHTNLGLKYGFYGYGDNSGYYTDLASAISAYNSQGTITLYNHEYDYGSATGSIKLIHCGHEHFDLDPDYEEYMWGGVPVIVSSCAKAWGSSASQYYTPITGVDDLYKITEADQDAAHANSYGYRFFYYTDRTLGTIKECLFDVVSVNSTKATVMRIGAGHDREYDLD